MVLCFSSKIETHKTEKEINQLFETQRYCLNRLLLKAKYSQATGWRETAACGWQLRIEHVTVGQHLEVTQYSLSLWGKKAQTQKLKILHDPCEECTIWELHSVSWLWSNQLCFSSAVFVSMCTCKQANLRSLTFSSSYSTAKSLLRRMSKVYTVWEDFCLKAESWNDPGLLLLRKLSSGVGEACLDEAHETCWKEVLAAEMCGTCPHITGNSMSHAAAQS